MPTISIRLDEDQDQPFFGVGKNICGKMKASEPSPTPLTISLSILLYSKPSSTFRVKSSLDWVGIFDFRFRGWPKSDRRCSGATRSEFGLPVGPGLSTLERWSRLRTWPSSSSSSTRRATACESFCIFSLVPTIFGLVFQLLSSMQGSFLIGDFRPSGLNYRSLVIAAYPTLLRSKHNEGWTSRSNHW